MRRRWLPSLLFAAALVSCGDGPTAVSNGVVSVVRDGGSLRITNLTDEARAFSAYDPNWLALADLSLTALCTTWEPSCLRLPANTTILVKLTDVGGYSSSTASVTITTWRVVMSEVNGQLEAVVDPGLQFKL